MHEAPGRYLQRALGMALGLGFSLAGVSDVLGAVVVVPGLSPAAASPGLRMAIGCAVLACGVGCSCQRHLSTLPLCWWCCGPSEACGI